MWVELSPADARPSAIAEGDMVDVAAHARNGSRPGPRQRHPCRRRLPAVPLRLLGHRGPRPAHDRAANELTLTSWDPVSKQPLFKAGAVSVTKVADGTKPAPARSRPRPDRSWRASDEPPRHHGKPTRRTR